MQIGIVVLVAALMSGAIVSVLARVVAQQSGERVLGIAHTVALMPAVRDAFNSPDPPAIIQPLAESVRQAAGVSLRRTAVSWRKAAISGGWRTSTSRAR